MRALLALAAGAVLLSALPAGRLFVEHGFAQQGSAPSSEAARRERAYRANNAGVAALEQFNYQDAAERFREALALGPDLAIARANLALALLYAGQTAEAAAAARQAAAALPDTPQAHYALGLALKANDEPAEAAAAFERVLKLVPGDAGARIHLGQIHLQQRQYEQALALFREAVAAEPYNVTAAYNAALALTRSGLADEGRAAMQRFETLRDSAYGVTYAQTYLSQGRLGEAITSSGAEPDLVDARTPAVTFTNATTTVLPEAPPAKPSEGGVTLFDRDGDGDLDLLEVDPAGLRLLRNEGGRFADATAAAGLTDVAGGRGAVAGDANNDGRADLLVFGERSPRLLRQTAAGTFESVSATEGSGEAGADSRAAAFADIDHDGDLDAVLAGRSLHLLRNDGAGRFSDITADAVAGGVAGGIAVAATDFDNRRDIDLVILQPDGPVLLRNMRDGTFRQAAQDVGLTANGTLTALAMGDVNKDGYPDFAFGRRDAPPALALSDGQAKFRMTDGPDAAAGARALQFVDYDNDGLLDLFVLREDGARLFRQAGGGTWTDVSEAAGLRAVLTKGAAPAALALGDLDADGDPDAVVRLAGGALSALENEGSANQSLRVRLDGRVSNRSGIGARLEMRAGSLRQMLDATSASPAVAPADLVFGLGERAAADAVRVLWPSGVLQAETALAGAGATPAAKAGAASVEITELDRKPSSCPYLFTWNGERFEFVTDFLGGGEMGAWLAPSVWNSPDPDEYVRIREDQLRPRNGRYELRVTNELEEALFVDRLQLLAVDHDRGVDVFPNEGLTSPPRPPFRLTAVRDARPPVRAVDDHGHDVLPQLMAVDRTYPDDFATLPIRGYAAPHALVIDLGPAAANPVLLLTGWTDYAFSNDNVAASQAGAVMSPPSLQVRDAGGAWQTVVPEIGFPVGRPQTIVVDLAGKFPGASREVRVVTSMRIYWDQILVARAVSSAGARVTRLEPVTADLRWRGLSAEVTPDGREPFGYDYQRVSLEMPWKTMVGRYTREGDVRPLLRRIDDLFVISRPGDEIALGFEALPPPAAGRTRTFLLFAHGYSKEMNPRSAIPDTVAPLPFRAMSGYPYPASEHYPRSEAHRAYQAQYNTRVVSRPWPSLDVLVAGRAADRAAGGASGRAPEVKR